MRIYVFKMYNFILLLFQINFRYAFSLSKMSTFIDTVVIQQDGIRTMPLFERSTVFPNHRCLNEWKGQSGFRRSAPFTVLFFREIICIRRTWCSLSKYSLAYPYLIGDGLLNVNHDSFMFSTVSPVG